MTDNLHALYADHLKTTLERHDRALAATGFDHAVIFSGSQRLMFLDDMPYPFKVNPHFKAWVPVVDNPNSFIVYTPGQKPKLVFHQPVDYWHKSAKPPAEWWGKYFDVVPIGKAEEANAHFPAKGRVARIGEWDQGADANINPEALLNFLHFERSRKRTTRSSACGAQMRGARGDTSRRNRRSARESPSMRSISPIFGPRITPRTSCRMETSSR
jgi:Xaa-Pro dipeptidase